MSIRGEKATRETSGDKRKRGKEDEGCRGGGGECERKEEEEEVVNHVKYKRNESNM